MSHWFVTRSCRGHARGVALQYPSVSIQLTGMNRAVDVISKGLDLAIRVRPLPQDDNDLAMRVPFHLPVKPTASTRQAEIFSARESSSNAPGRPINTSCEIGISRFHGAPGVSSTRGPTT